MTSIDVKCLPESIREYIYENMEDYINSDYCRNGFPQTIYYNPITEKVAYLGYKQTMPKPWVKVIASTT